MTDKTTAPTDQVWRWPRLLRSWSAMRLRKFEPLRFARRRGKVYRREQGRRWLKGQGL